MELKKRNTELALREDRISKTVNHYPELSRLMTDQNKDVVLRKFGRKKLSEAIALRKLKLSEIQQAYGKGEDHAGSMFLAPYISHIQEVCGFETMTPLQLESVTEDFYDELYFLSIPELAVFVKQFCKNKLTKELYGKLTSKFIVEAADNFKKQRAKALAEIDKEENGVETSLNHRAEFLKANAPDFVTDPKTGEKRESIFRKLKQMPDRYTTK